MKLKSLILENFRGYTNKTKINFENLTTIIGKNDVGKSTILEALEIFFNNNIIKIESIDKNIHSTYEFVEISCEFEDLPEIISIDSSSETTLEAEYLLTIDKSLIIKKVFDCSKKIPSVEIFITANHPTNTDASNLLELKEKELQNIIKTRGLDSKLKGNPQMRAAIWGSIENLELKSVEIPVSKPKEDAKRIWEQIEMYLPIFALFQSDRNSSDADNEVQDPMKAAISIALAEVQDDIDRIQKKVKEKAEEIANNTHKVLETIDKNLANRLDPKFTPPTQSKWNNLFSIQMDTDGGIPLNKRGSGVRRIILVSFFKAEAERRLKDSSKKNIIYALEEPETAQHPNNQKILIESFKTLANENDCQIILTTHSPGLASDLPIESLRFVYKNEKGEISINQGKSIFPIVAATLGVTPDSRVKVIVCLEGPTDVIAIKCLSKALSSKYPNLPDLSTDDRIAFIIMGGSTLKYWVDENYLMGLDKPEFHLYDNDVSTYQKSIDQVNDRGDNSFGTLTKKCEIENYLHKDAIKLAFDIEMEIPDFKNPEGKSVPTIFGEEYAMKKHLNCPMGDNKSKKFLADKAFPKMTAEMIEARDLDGEVKGWFEKINNLLSL